jgi:hypothetical protein
MSDVNLANLAIMQMIARSLAAHYAPRRRNAPEHPWRVERRAALGLSAALKIVNERAEALRRSKKEGRSV